MWYAVTYAIMTYAIIFICFVSILLDIAIENYKRMKRLGTVRSA